jgi:hypothetical protein
VSGGYRRVPEDPIDDLLERTGDLERRLKELEAPTGTQVAETVATIDDVIALQTVPGAATGSSSAFSPGTAEGAKCSTSVVVPEGFTRALLIGVGSVSLIYQWPSGSGIDTLTSKIRLSGNDGQPLTMTGSELNVSGWDAFRTMTNSHSFVATGLSGGATLTAELRLSTATNNWTVSGNNRATITLMALFMR